MSRNGFTLVELIIVFAIVGILAAIMVPACNKVIKHEQVNHPYSSVSNGSVDGIERGGHQYVHDPSCTCRR